MYYIQLHVDLTACIPRGVRVQTYVTFLKADVRQFLKTSRSPEILKIGR